MKPTAHHQRLATWRLRQCYPLARGQVFGGEEGGAGRGGGQRIRAGEPLNGGETERKSENPSQYNETHAINSTGVDNQPDAERNVDRRSLRLTAPAPSNYRHVMCIA
jgi:hypothetical protein